MKKFSFLLAASALSAGSMIVAAPAAAQQTTSGVQGTVQAEDGSAISGATVTVTDTRTGATSTLTTGSEGRFSVQNLPTGGPYTVTAVAGGYQGQTVNEIFITLSGATSLTFELANTSAEVSEDAIVITGARATETVLAVGPGQSIGIETLESLPTINRDIRDFIRIDPRVSIEASTDEVDRISCLGGNDRSNVFTVDGIAQADLFGLNGTPFASRNSLPLPFDSVKETAIEFAPFDVEYGAFTGCAINVVTKSGTNEFHGSAFFEYRDENLRGDTVGGEEFIPAPFDEKRWGVTLGGPIFKDRLFFFAGYEELDSSSIIEIGPNDSGFANPRDYVSEAQFEEFSSILSSVYNRETGPIPTSAAETNVRYFGRLDAYINDDHRLELTYQRLEEENIEPDFSGDQYGGLNSFELEGTTSDYYSARLFSQWSDNFSTELRYSRAEVGDVQGPVGGGEAQSDNPKTRIQVAVGTPECGTTAAPTPNAAGCEIGWLVDGPGIFRSANQLDTAVDQLKAIANLQVEDHAFTLGFEANMLDVFNLFITDATGTLYFSNFDDLREGLLMPRINRFFPSAEDAFTQTGNGFGAAVTATPTGDPNEAAAEWKRQIYSVYVQDDWAVNDQLNVLLGLRAEFYEGDTPRENPLFVQRYGISNGLSFGDLSPVLLPRLGVSYNFDNEGFLRNSKLTGGVGIFSGGDPAVWLSNAFSNNGFLAGGNTFFGNCSGEPAVGSQLDVVTNGEFTGLPDCAFENAKTQAAKGEGDTQSTDQNLEIPTVLRANLGFGTRFGDNSGGFLDNWQLNVDYIYSRYYNPFNFVDLSMVPDTSRIADGRAVDGRPIYNAIDPLRNNCDATLQNGGGTPPVFTNVTNACFGTSNDDYIQLTNSKGYDSHALSFILRKNWRGGLITQGGGGYFNFGYAYTDAEERRTNDNSTATSGYDRTAAFDRQQPDVRQSSYVSEHNFSVSLGLREEFFDDYETSLGIFFRASSGRPYSIVYGEGTRTLTVNGVRNFIGFQDSASGDDNALAYIPTGPNDPNLSPLSNAGAVEDFLDFMAGTNCEYELGASIAANTCRNDWAFDMDLRIAQEIPGPGRLFGVDDRIELFATMDNFLNFLDSDWNALRTYGNSRSMIEGGVDNDGRYVISAFNGFNDEEADIRVNSSIWRLKVGLRYEF